MPIAKQTLAYAERMLHLAADGEFRVLYDAIPIDRIAGHPLQAARAAVDAIIDAGQVRVGYDLFPFLDTTVAGVSVDDFVVLAYEL